MTSEARAASTDLDPAQTQLVDDILAAVTRRIENARLPVATYRVQFNAQCTFRDVAAIVPYLNALGISDLYASPFLQARPGSGHGYDIVNHGVINPEIGTLEDLRDLSSALRRHNMGLIADVVPNHMAAAPQLNAWWQDVLENGPSSSFAAYFDIDWMPLKPDLAHKVLLPVLGDQYGDVLEAGQLVVCYGDGTFWLTYFEHRFPIAPGTYDRLLALRLPELEQLLGAEQPDLLELRSILTAIRNLPRRTETNAERLSERRREKEIIKRRLHELVTRSAAIAEFVAENVRIVNGRAGDPRSYDLLDELLQDQAYRLSYWRVAADEINYRRFFDINDLAAVCTENPAVFADTHRLLFELQDQEIVTGLRIDHPDGLYDPWQYFCSLQECHFLRLCRKALNDAAEAGRSLPAADPSAVLGRLLELWRAAASIPGSPLARPLFVVVEKILAPDEELPEDWPVHGTVGYEFLNVMNGILVDASAERSMSRLFERFTGEVWDFSELAYRCKRLIVRMSMASELNVLGDRLDRLSERNRRTRDFTLNSLTRALQEVVASFSVYRTYVRPGHVLERDVRYVERAVARAKRRNPAMSSLIFDFVRDVLLLRNPVLVQEEEVAAVQRFTGKFQQLTGPIMAKAVEDTALYRFNRLVSLNEVGGEPARFGTSVAAMHRFLQSRQPRHTHALNAGTTHDTKRSEDVRARISVLSEVPRQWQDQVQSWSRAFRRFKTEVDGSEAPSRKAEYLLYQTLVGVWPNQIPVGADRERLQARIQQHMLKVEREAKVHTSWINPHEAYESALHLFVAALFDGRRPKFLGDLHNFAVKAARHGCWNSLSQLLIKTLAPGVPDFYQGAETWHQALVDPDNRRPVDFSVCLRNLSELQAEMGVDLGGGSGSVFDSWLRGHAPSLALLGRLLDSDADGRIKLFVTALSLNARRRYGELFTRGEYLPLETTGKFAESVVAFARRHQDRCAVTIVPRLTVRVVGFGGSSPIGDIWEDTAVILPGGLQPTDSSAPPFQELFSRQQCRPHPDSRGVTVLRVAESLKAFPVACWLPGAPETGQP